MRALLSLTLLGAALLAGCGARSALDAPFVGAGGAGGPECAGVLHDGGVDLGCPTASLNGHCYLFCQDHRAWPDALAACQSVGMSLLSIDDDDENTWVYGVEDGISTEKAWMGLTDQAVEGTFVWASGDAVTYTNWESGEPNGGTSENCGQINRFYPDLGWNDEPCAEALHYVCESL